MDMLAKKLKMSKAILIMDTPDSCVDCILVYCEEIFDDENYYRGDDCFCRARWPQRVNEWYEDETKPEWCPLKKLPNYRNEKAAVDIGIRDCGFIDGWNACLDEITNTGG